MQVKEAKDFLVQQAAEQAQRDGVPLSDLEKRMMYFTEGDDALEDPVALNEEFEAQCDMAEYETKITRLLVHAYRRLRKESPTAAATWDTAIRKLKKGDHYILVMWAQRSSTQWGFWKTMGASLLFVVSSMALIALLDHYNIHGSWTKRGAAVSGTYTSLPTWFQWSILALMLGGYVYVVFPAACNRSAQTISQLIARLLRVSAKNSPDRK